MKAYIVEIESENNRDDYGRLKKFYRISSGSPHQWWSRKHGWIYPRKKNIKFYSTFHTRQGAEKELENILKKQPVT